MKRMVDFGVAYGGGTADMKLLAWVDADHATCPDTRRSVPRDVVMIAGGTTRGSCRAQTEAAAAISESEYVALTEVVNRMQFLQQLKALMTPPIDYETKIYADNEGPMKVAKDRFCNSRTERIDIKHHVVRDAVDGNIARAEYVESGEQHVYVLAKELGGVKTFEDKTILWSVCVS